MERLAAEPNTAVKISGLGLPGRPWTVEANGPVIRDAIAIFGPDRAMFASNYPVDSLVGGFATIWHGFCRSRRGSARTRSALRSSAATHCASTGSDDPPHPTIHRNPTRENEHDDNDRLHGPRPDGRGLHEAPRRDGSPG